MTVQVHPQAQELLGTNELVSITERGDDVALLSGQMGKMGFVEGLDRPIPRHGKPLGRSWGWTAGLWLAYLLTAGDHRKVSVAAYSKGMQHTLSQLSGPDVEPGDGSDARVAHLLKHLRKPQDWPGIAGDLHARRLAGYDWSQDLIRCDAPTVSGAHEVTDKGLMQCGHSQDDPRRPQRKVMRGSLDPLGMPLATDVLSGERAEDGLSLPLLKRIEAGLSQTGLLFVGDGKMRAWGPRAYVVSHHPLSLSPRPCPGTPAEAIADGISAGRAPTRDGELARVFRIHHRAEAGLAAEGYEVERPCCREDGAVPWRERG